MDEAGRPTDHPPVMAEDVEQAYIDARGSSATADHLKGLSSDEPRQHSLRGHRSRPSDNPDLASKSGQTRELDEFIEYHVYRNDQFIAATTDTVFTDQLPAYGDYEYRVTAYYDPEGESIPSVPATVNWQPVTYSLAPVNAVVPYSGGTITYDALLFNELPQAFQNVSYRVYATLPDGSEVGPLFQRNFTLAPGAYHSISGLTQTVPANAPPGNYFLHGRLYSQGQPVYEQTFQFDKMGGGE
ncbi:hypothetical protein KQI52_15295 [bacterium]|nr:hypothetical protein [bacterium]